jgi:hypothetical protein
LRGKLPTRTGARPYYNRPLENIVGVTIHYTASSPYTTVENIAAYQTGPNAQEEFPAVAYSLIVTADGSINLCHDLNIRCWHSGAVVNGVARNASHIGICWCGNTSPTPEQIQGLAGAIAWCEAQLGRRLEIEGHKDAFATSCPGEGWPSWKDSVISAREALR